MKKPYFILTSIALLAFSSMPALAINNSNMGGMKMDAPKVAVGKAHKAQGIVNSIDMPTAKVNLSHEAIPSLHWPKMTMSFMVSDKQGLSKLKPGQHVDFELSEKTPGQYVITKIVPIE